MGVLSASLQPWAICLRPSLTEETGAGEVITGEQEAPRLMLTPETLKQRRGGGRSRGRALFRHCGDLRGRIILGMLSVQDPVGNRVPLPENPYNMKQGQEAGIASVCLNKLTHSKSSHGSQSCSQYHSVVSRENAEVIPDLPRTQQELC